MSKKRVLIVDDERLIRWSVAQKLASWGYETAEAEDAATAQTLLARESPDLVLLDLCLPDQRGTELLRQIKSASPSLPVVIITAHGILEEAVEAMRAGAHHFLTKPINFEELQITIETALEVQALRQEVDLYKEREKKKFDMRSIVAESEAMKRVVELTQKVARSEASLVLLTGESGSGKDLLSRTIHETSRRSQRPFLAINCSAIPETLLESELFGYEKGAFTDARAQKKGLLELADGGTILLDEVTELTLGLQAKFLRFLEERQFKRVGGLTDIEVDVRILAATNIGLDEASREGKFRRDLYYRLTVMPIHIPPLRERPEDVIPLANQFLRGFNVKFRKNVAGLTRAAEELLQAYDWPGNVRELRNAIERAMILEEGDVLDANAFALDSPPGALSGACEDEGSALDGSASLDEVERSVIEKALVASQWNQSRAARLLKVSRDKLRYKMKKHHLTEGKAKGEG